MPESTVRSTPTRLHTFAGSAAGFAAVMAAIAVACAVLVWQVERLPGSDDYKFLESITGSNGAPGGTGYLLDWLAWRYETWSGRIVPEVFIWLLTPAPLIFWRIGSLLVWLATILIAVRLLVVARPGSGWLARSGMAIGAFAVLFLFDRGVLQWGVFWVTGAMNYWWIVPFALAAALAGIEVLYRGAPRVWVIVVSTATAFIAAISSEQVAAILVVLGVVLVVAWFWRLRAKATLSRAADVAVLAPALAAVAGAIVLFAAPGNAGRVAGDERQWLPGFSDAPMLDRLIGGLQFTVDAMVNRTGILLPLIWLALIATVLISQRRDRVAVGTIAVSLAGLATVIGAPLLQLPILVQFSPVWQVRPDGVIGTTVLVLWSLGLLATAAAPVLLWRDRTGVMQSLLIAAAYASTFVISTSPSMYASGPRVFFTSAIALGVVVLAMVPAALRDRSPLARAATLLPVLALAGIAYVAVFTYLRWGG